MRSLLPLPQQVLALALVVLAAASSAGAASAPREAVDGWDGDEPRLTARLRVDPRDDGEWRVGVELEPAPGWHVYWRNPGDTGLPPRIEWRLAGARFGEIAWPAPRAFVDPEADLVSFGYDQPVLLATTASLPRERARLEVAVEALVCANLCLPASFVLGTELLPDAPADVRERARFDAAAEQVPRDAARQGVHVALVAPLAGDADGRLRATFAVFPCGVERQGVPCDVGSAAGAGPGLLPYASPQVAWIASPPRPHAEGADRRGAFAVDLEAIWLGSGDPANLRMAGVVPLRDLAGRERSVEVSLDAIAAGASRPARSEAEPSEDPTGLPSEDRTGSPSEGRTGAAVRSDAAACLRAVLLGWIGGLVLNLMPCVLPVLAIKLASLASLAQGSRRAHRWHAFAYTSGIALSMLGLASVVLGLRAAGTAVGWGFQLQEPRFLVAIACLLVAFALNLFGAFEIDVDTQRLGRLGSDAPGAARSFFDGLLAVALATPCSAPFLGTAVGFAFASSAPVIVSIFLAIGLGLATPLIAAAAFPGWARRLPRSGAWMEDLRAVLAFALLLTVVWLLWILGRVSGAGAMAAALALLLAVAAAAWLLGKAQHRGRRLPASLLAGVLGGVAAAGLASLDFAPSGAANTSAPAIRVARPFTASAVSASLDAGRPVFVYFTADWCVTCKVNEKRVLADPRVESEVERLGFDVYRADWTRRDEAVRAALARLGKAGVPVYALYAPGGPRRPQLLPELLTLDGMLDALREAAAHRVFVTGLTE